MVTLDVETAKAPPLHERDGVILVGDTRMPLDAVIGAYQRGRSPEDIVDAFPSLHLADVYAVISYYLQNRRGVDAYMEEQRLRADQIRRENEERWPPEEFRERLLARRRAERHTR
jgi:uncharacterized protein (DUF433 family)